MSLHTFYMQNEGKNAHYIGQTVSTVKETRYSHASLQVYITQDGPWWAEQTNEKNNN